MRGGARRTAADGRARGSGTDQSLLWPDDDDHLSVAAARVLGAGVRAASPLADSRCGLAGTSNGTHALFAGGLSTRSFSSYGYSTAVDAYAADGARRGVGLLSEARGFLTATTVQHGGVHVSLFAGGNDNGEFKTRVDVLDHRTGAWRTAELSEARKEAAAGTAGRFAVFAGGVRRCGVSTSFCTTTTVDVYDTAADRWTSGALADARYMIGATALGDRIYFAGGESQAGGENDVTRVFDTVSYFDAASGTVGELGSVLSVARSRIAAVTISGRALFLGGYAKIGGVVAAKRIDVFDGTEWSSSIMDLDRGFVNAAAVPTSSGEAILAGGGIHTRAPTTQDAVYRVSWSDGPAPTPAPPDTETPMPLPPGVTLPPTPATDAPTPVPVTAIGTAEGADSSGTTASGEFVSPGVPFFPATPSDSAPGGGGGLGLPVISAIAAGALCVVLVCIGVYCYVARNRRDQSDDDGAVIALSQRKYTFEKPEEPAVTKQTSTVDLGGTQLTYNEMPEGLARKPLPTQNEEYGKLPISEQGTSHDQYAVPLGDDGSQATTAGYVAPFDRDSGSTYAGGHDGLFRGGGLDGGDDEAYVNAVRVGENESRIAF